MPEPRLGATPSPSRDRTRLGHTALRELALIVLAQQSGSEETAETPAVSARRAYARLAEVSTPLIGQIGVDALLGRALHLAHREYPWLSAAPDSDEAKEPFARLLASLSRQNPASATEGAAAVLATFADLLVTFIGEPLTAGLLRKAWPNAFSDAQHKET